MASKKNSTDNTKTAPANDEATKALKAKIKDLPKPAQALILRNAAGEKLTRAEIGELRTFKLTKNGEPIKVHTGPRERAQVNAVAVANVIEMAGIEGLTKMHTKYGSALKKPLLQYVKGLTDGDDKSALETLARTFFPRAKGAGGFSAREDQIVGKTMRVAILVAGIAAEGDRVKKEQITLPDGRVGLFVWKLSPAATAGAAASQGAAQPSSGAGAPSWAGAGASA